MKIKILTLFPEMIEPMISGSILGRAIKAGHLDVELINIRDYTQNKHKNTDDYPFGGGAGMVMMPQPVVDAIEANAEPGMRRIPDSELASMASTTGWGIITMPAPPPKG